MIPLEKVRSLVVKHTDLEKELSTGTIDPKTFAQKSKEYSELGSIISYAIEYLRFDNDQKDLEQMIKDKNSDSEMIILAEKELNELKKKRNDYTNKLKIYLLPKDKDDNKNAIVEIRAGTGGLEASLFCADLFKMYEKVCSKKKWTLEIINISKSEAGGFKEVIFSVNGSTSQEFIEYKEYRRQKPKEECILQLLQLQFYLRPKK
jgi:peptide chain release factor 1